MLKKKSEKLDPNEEIKRLLVAQLIVNGVSTDVIGEILEVDGSAVRRMVPASKLNSQKSKK